MIYDKLVRMADGEAYRGREYTSCFSECDVSEVKAMTWANLLRRLETSNNDQLQIKVSIQGNGYDSSSRLSREHVYVN